MSQAWQVVGLGWGDESKGSCVEKLTKELSADLIVRFNGGGQAAHNCVTSDGRHHTFSQFGSGSMISDKVRTHLSRFMLVDPFTMMREAVSLPAYNVWNRTTIDENAIIVTPLHKNINRNREDIRDAIGEGRHGSCGMGIGIAREVEINNPDIALRVRDLNLDSDELKTKLFKLYDLFADELGQVVNGQTAAMMQSNAWLEQMKIFPKKTIVSSMPSFECAVFEGAQGVLLDEKHGQAPHNTWTNTTFENADTLLDEVGVKDRTRIGCLRTYHTRHGAGPFPTENNSLDLPELHNGTGEYQGNFRVGSFDFMKARQAIDIVGGIDFLALSHIDYLYRMGLREEFAEDIAETLQVSLGMTAYGPTADHRTIQMGVAV